IARPPYTDRLPYTTLFRSTVSSDNSNTTWKSSSTTGAPIGSYTVAVQQLATASRLAGGGDIGAGLSPTANVASLTLANLATAIPDRKSTRLNSSHVKISYA